jgi:hypothetical protein
MKTKEKKISVTIQFVESTHKKIVKLAQSESRKVAGFVRHQIEQLIAKSK